MKNKNVILQGALIIVLLIMLIIGFSMAWFSQSTINEVNDFTIDVGSADTFELSFDGINYNRQLSLKLFNSQDYNSSVELADLTGVYEEVTSDNNVTFKSLKLFSPVRDEYTGTPVLNSLSEWGQAINSKVIYSGNNYYVVSTDDEGRAQYVEFDLWIRSDSDLEIYLGDESKLEPVKTTSEENVIPALYSSTINYKYLQTTRYLYGNNDLYRTVIKDENDNYFVFDDNNQFIIKYRYVEINNITYTYYYDNDNNLILKSRDIYNNDSYSHTKYYTSTDNSFISEIFRTDYVTSGTSTFYRYQSSSGVTLDNDGIAALNLNECVYTYLGNRAFSSGDLHIPNEGGVVTQNPYTSTTYYNEKGQFLIRKDIDNNVTTYYDINGDVVDNVTKEYKVIVPSNYGKTLYTLVNDCVVSSSVSQTFSKNLAAGAALVSFSEMVTDSFSGETKEVENLKYIWNPLPYYGLQSEEGYSESLFTYDENRTEPIYYYTCDYNDVTGRYEYVRASWNKEVDDPTKIDSLIRTGLIQTTEHEVLNYETPLVKTEIEEGRKFCVKKIRVKVWIDGNDEIAENSMLNSSATGNGQINVSLKLVSNVNKTNISAVKLSNGVYALSASKISGAAETYQWNVSGSWWTHDHLARFDIATITPDPEYPTDTSKARLTFNQVGTVTVYATDSLGRVGALLITYDFATIEVSHVPDTNVYELSLDGASSAELESGNWYISNNVIASLVVNNETKVATVTLNSSGTVRVSFKIIKQIENVTYDVEVAYDIVHTYVGDGD